MSSNLWAFGSDVVEIHKQQLEPFSFRVKTYLAVRVPSSVPGSEIKTLYRLVFGAWLFDRQEAVLNPFKGGRWISGECFPHSRLRCEDASLMTTWVVRACGAPSAVNWR